MTTRSQSAARLTQFVDELMPSWPAQDVAVALVHFDGSVEAWGMGPTTNLADRLFQIGSISKSLVAVTTLRCIESGVLSLDDDVVSILPWVEAGERPLRVRELLSHTAGLIQGGDGVPDEQWQVWDLRHRARAAGSHFHYSNVGYMLLGLILSEVLKCPVAKALRKAVFEPLGMTHSRGDIGSFDSAAMARGLWPVDRMHPWAPGDPIEPAVWLPATAADGCVMSSARELAMFARLLLGDGSVDGLQILTPAGLIRLTTPVADGGEGIVNVRGLRPVLSSRYALGVNSENIGEHHCITHGGGMLGYQSFLLADRTAGVAVVALTNANGNFPMAQVIARVGHQLLLDWDVQVPPGDDPVLHGDIESHCFATFVSDCDPSLTIKVERGEQGDVRIRGPQGSGVLTRIWSGRFVCDLPGLNTHHWDAVSGGWNVGPHQFRGPGPGNACDAIPHPLSGTYRSHSPWFPVLRVFERGGNLLLSAPGGVEAPEFDEPLTEIRAGVWRIGAQSWLPERLECGPVIDGRAISVTRDGVVYSRVS